MLWTKEQIQLIIDTYVPDDCIEIIEITLTKGRYCHIRWVELDEHQQPIMYEERLYPGWKPTVTMIRSRN